jgi:hypothetical protein
MSTSVEKRRDGGDFKDFPRRNERKLLKAETGNRMVRFEACRYLQVSPSSWRLPATARPCIGRCAAPGELPRPAVWDVVVSVDEPGLLSCGHGVVRRRPRERPPSRERKNKEIKKCSLQKQYSDMKFRVLDVRTFSGKALAIPGENGTNVARSVLKMKRTVLEPVDFWTEEKNKAKQAMCPAASAAVSPWREISTRAVDSCSQDSGSRDCSSALLLSSL